MFEEKRKEARSVIEHAIRILRFDGYLEISDKFYLEEVKQKFEDVMRKFYRGLFLKKEIIKSFDEVELLIEKFKDIFLKPDKYREKIVNFYKEFRYLFSVWVNLLV